MTSSRILTACAAIAALLLAGCSSTGGARNNTAESASSGSSQTSQTIAVISHGAQGDSFWDVVKKGAEDAGERFNAKVTYQGEADPQAQSQAIDNAVAQHVNGIVVSMANPDGVKDSVEAAVAAGIPVVTINAGQEQSAQFGALEHIGQDESVAGNMAGRQFKEAGATKVLCVIHEAGNISQETRCKGAEEAFGGPMPHLQVDISNLSEAESTIKTALQADPSIDGVLTLNSAVATSAAQAISGLSTKPILGTFDLDKDVLGLIQNHSASFAIDQQPYLQGFLGVQSLVMHNEGGFVLGGGEPVLTGPAVVTAENVDTAAEGIEAGIR